MRPKIETKMIYRIRQGHHGEDAERGAILILFAVALLALLATAALVVDISATRNDRSISQISADAAAAAAGVELGLEGAAEACEVAFSYLAANSGEALVGDDCSLMLSECAEANYPVEITRTAPGFTATIVHPVIDFHPAMSSSTAGSPDMPLFQIDGASCDRIAVQIERERRVYFGAFIGAGQATTSVHAVALVSVQDERSGRPIQMLLLNATDCEVIDITGGGRGGGVQINSSTNPLTGEVFPGVVAIDSDGTTNCGRKGVIGITGGGGTGVRVDGPPNCDDEVSPGTGAGCGVVEMFSAGEAGGCVMPACVEGSNVQPGPSALAEPVTRSQVDHRYNCKASYHPLDIPGCTRITTHDAWIDQLVDELGDRYAPSGYRDFEDEGYSCNVRSSVVIPVGNWWVDCPELSISRELNFLGGNVVVTGEVAIGSRGSLMVNTANPNVYNWTAGTRFDPEANSAGAAVFFVQSGEVSKGGGGTLHLNNTLMYLGDDAEFTSAGGNGLTTWLAPTEGPFEDLALWSDSDSEILFSGNADMDLTGAFFAPDATLRFQGNAGNTSLKAQIIVDSFTSVGSSKLILNPDYDRMVLFDQDSESGLIR